MYLFSSMFIEVYQVKRLVEHLTWEFEPATFSSPFHLPDRNCSLPLRKDEDSGSALPLEYTVTHTHTLLCSDIMLLCVSDWFNRRSNSNRMRCHDIRFLSCKIWFWLRRIVQILWPPEKLQPHGKLYELFVLFICVCVSLKTLKSIAVQWRK